MMIDLPLFIWATQFWVLTGSQRTENQRTQQLFFRNSAEPATFLHVLLPDTHLTFPQKSSRTCRLNPICLPTNTLLPTQTHTQTPHTLTHTYTHTHTHSHTPFQSVKQRMWKWKKPTKFSNTLHSKIFAYISGCSASRVWGKLSRIP